MEIRMLRALTRWLPGGRGRERRLDVQRAAEMGAELASPIVPAVLLLAGAGAAFWWYRQWSRGRAEDAGPALGEAGRAALDESISVQGERDDR
jgi:hypothetical protein